MKYKFVQCVECKVCLECKVCVECKVCMEFKVCVECKVCMACKVCVECWFYLWGLCWMWIEQNDTNIICNTKDTVPVDSSWHYWVFAAQWKVSLFNGTRRYRYSLDVHPNKAFTCCTYIWLSMLPSCHDSIYNLSLYLFTHQFLIHSKIGQKYKINFECIQFNILSLSQ